MLCLARGHRVDHRDSNGRRIESRAIWTSTRLNDDLHQTLDVRGVGQSFVIERRRTDRKTGKSSVELACGNTSHSSDSAGPRQVLALNRGRWSIENGCHWVLDRTWDEGRSAIRTGHGPQNTSGLRCFAIGLIRSRTADGVAPTIRRLMQNTRPSSTSWG